MTAAPAMTAPASQLVFEVEEPVLANTFIEVRGYFHTDTPDGPKSGAYSGVYRLWHDGLWYPNGTVTGPVSRTWAELVCPEVPVDEVFITVLAIPAQAA